MVFLKDLESAIIKRHLVNGASELLILGGFIGPSPVQKISNESIITKIIYGGKEKGNLTKELHEKYKSYSGENTTEVFYKKSYNHSKVYCWHDNGVVKEIIAGSANFSHSGLNNDFVEVLFLLDPSDYTEIYQYLSDALDDSESCLLYPYEEKHKLKSFDKKKPTKIKFDQILSTKPPSARISFKDRRGNYSQINTGVKYATSNVPRDDCVISLKTALVEEIPDLFPNNGVNPMIGKGHGNAGKKRNAPKKFRVEFLWDDSEVMEMSFESKGKSTPNGNLYKSLRSAKNELLGKYLRKRMGLKSGDSLTATAFQSYGRDHIDLTLIDDGIYFADFSVSK